MTENSKYFDYNATTPLSPAAKEEWLRVANEHWHNPSSLYREAGAARQLLEDLRENLADLLGCGDEPERIIFTSGATEANNAVMRFLADSTEAIGISPVEHPSVRDSANREFGSDRTTELPLNGDLSAFSGGAVSVMAANNETGILYPWKEIAAQCKARELPFHCDASQWIGKLPADDIAAHCDFVTGCAHKFGGPKGVGFLILPGEETAEDFLSLVGGPQEFDHRAGTEDLAGIAAMVTALEERIANPVEDSSGRDAFEAQVTESGNYQLIGNTEARLWNTSMFVLPHSKNLKWLTRLSARGFAVSTGSACSAGKSNPSHVMQAMGLSFEEMGQVLRVSGGWDTTPEDWMALADALEEVAKELR